MTRLLILAASLGLAVVQAAAACDFHQSASKVDETKVASTAGDTQNVSTPTSQSTQSTVIVKKEKTVTPAESK